MALSASAGVWRRVWIKAYVLAYLPASISAYEPSRFCRWIQSNWVAVPSGLTQFHLRASASRVLRLYFSDRCLGFKACGATDDYSAPCQAILCHTDGPVPPEIRRNFRIQLGQKRRSAPLMQWKRYVGLLLDAMHWTAIIFAGMLAVMFLSWALVITAPQSRSTAGEGDAAQIINLAF